MRIERYRASLSVLLFSAALLSLAGCGSFHHKPNAEETQRLQQEIRSYYASVAKAFETANAQDLASRFTPEITTPMTRDKIMAWGTDFFSKQGRAQFRVENLVFNETGPASAVVTLTYSVTTTDGKGNFGGTERDVLVKRGGQWLMASWQAQK